MGGEGTFEKVHGFPRLLTEQKQHFCPGCSHGILAKVIAEVIGEMGAGDSSVGVYGVGCAGLMYRYVDVKGVAAPPGSAVGIAAGIKEGLPEEIIFAYLGEADLCTDLSMLLGAAMRGSRITVIVENNLNMAVSGGALSPASPLGMITTTSPRGRSVAGAGYPLDIAGILKEVKGVAYLARGSTHTAGAVRRTKRMIERAFFSQQYDRGMGFVEVLGMCPTNLNLPPLEAAQYIRGLIDELPTGELRKG
jgi:2-oxoglutarate/2-oxoacid ferredoxin oxidoreductase subunit beta